MRTKAATKRACPPEKQSAAKKGEHYERYPENTDGTAQRAFLQAGSDSGGRAGADPAGGRVRAQRHGMQSAVMVAVQDPETIRTLSRINAEIMGTDGDPFYGAPTVVVVLAGRRRGTCVEDGSLVMGNLMNAAFSLGVDSCWIHRARETYETEEGKALLKKWGLSEDYIGIGNCILGYSDQPLPQPKPRKEGFVIRA